MEWLHHMITVLSILGDCCSIFKAAAAANFHFKEKPLLRPVSQRFVLEFYSSTSLIFGSIYWYLYMVWGRRRSTSIFCMYKFLWPSTICWKGFALLYIFFWALPTHWKCVKITIGFNLDPFLLLTVYV